MDRKTRSILLVDSSAALLFYLAMLLRRLEYKVMMARCAEDALRMMEENLPSIVVTEISLPYMNGVDLLGKIRDTARFRAVPVVVLTSETDQEKRDSCARMGCSLSQQAGGAKCALPHASVSERDCAP